MYNSTRKNRKKAKKKREDGQIKTRAINALKINPLRNNERRAAVKMNNINMEGAPITGGQSVNYASLLGNNTITQNNRRKNAPPSYNEVKIMNLVPTNPPAKKEQKWPIAPTNPPSYNKIKNFPIAPTTPNNRVAVTMGGSRKKKHRKKTKHKRRKKHRRKTKRRRRR